MSGPRSLSAALAVMLVACSDEVIPSTPLDPASSHVSQTYTAPVTQRDSLALVLAVAKHLALGLADSSARYELARTLKRSTVREGKIHLQRFVGHRGSGWGERISQKSRLGKSGWKNELSLLPDLELYLPELDRSSTHGPYPTAWAIYRQSVGSSVLDLGERQRVKLRL